MSAEALRAALGLPAQPGSSDEDVEEDMFDEEAARKYGVQWATDYADRGRDSSGEDEGIEDSDHASSEEQGVPLAHRKRSRSEEKAGVEPNGSSEADPGDGAEWGQGDRVTVDGRVGMVLRDMRPKHDRATIRWEDTGKEQKKVDATTIQKLELNEAPKQEKGKKKKRVTC